MGPSGIGVTTAPPDPLEPPDPPEPPDVPPEVPPDVPPDVPPEVPPEVPEPLPEPLPLPEVPTPNSVWLCDPQALRKDRRKPDRTIEEARQAK